MIRWPGKVPCWDDHRSHRPRLRSLSDLAGRTGVAQARAADHGRHQLCARAECDPAAELPERPIIIAAQNGCSIRLGDWKLYRDYKKPAFELYNLKDDLCENTDLIAQYPGKAEELETLLMDHFAATTGIPRVLKKRS